MLKIKFADDSELEVLDSTTIYPSSNVSVRSKMVIHAADYMMDLSSFEKMLADKEKIKEIRLIRTDEYGDVVSEVVYSNYVILSNVGKRRIDDVNYINGFASSEMHLVAELEQLTYIEQQLAAMGIEM